MKKKEKKRKKRPGTCEQPAHFTHTRARTQACTYTHLFTRAHTYTHHARAHAHTHAPQLARDEDHFDRMMFTLFDDYKDAVSGDMALAGYTFRDSPFSKDPFVSTLDHAKFVRRYVDS